uniref:Uncharacterized protein n=1 Tax=Pyricularia oryzae (strain 70-15 / ATCC MYA-4617 / FGSC 8958) TaxID=242507 RepID=Q2KGK4_PYRO7|nr:hypothetical protein MGCH7_ch7g331 [Pyricularia oryzae 70-15]
MLLRDVRERDYILNQPIWAASAATNI